MIESKQISSLINRYNENKLPHAFLFETNNYDKCYSDLINFIKVINCSFDFKEKCDNKECNLCNLISSNNLPSLVTIETDTLNIKLDQIIDLKEKFSTKPVFSKYNIYIIKQAEKLNSSSGNSLLKFLEEPDENILGFFITNNSERVISTIKSRCQTIICRYDESINLLDDEMLDNIKIYLNSIYKNKDDLFYNSNMLELYSERSDWELFFKSMLYYFRDCYFEKRKDKITLIKNISKENIVKIMVLIEEILMFIVSNVNIELVLDKFVLEMRKYYE